MKKGLLTIALLLIVAFAISAQKGGTTQDIGKALYNSLKNNNEKELSIYYPTLAELKIIKDAKSTKDDSTLLKFLAQGTAKKLNDDWVATKNKLQADGVIWDKASTPAVSHEPFNKDNREHTAVQVMFTDGNGKQHTASVKCVNINGNWYVIESIKPHAQAVN
ncbi:MAG: hypothetical protein M0D57_14100 [Sphingobacteriales bacterium JAD_PAG50586_3]|nr:MAG: hypothetical protein M0D57_14100 [Sphingobacteriales bacterium JAD_PAG50586_3]